MSEDNKLLMFFAEAIAGISEDIPFPAGTPHALMLFAHAPSFVEGQDIAVGGATEMGWLEVKVVKAGEIKDGPSSIDEEALRMAAEDAVEYGLGLVVYDSELPPEGLKVTPGIGVRPEEL
ncbi:hypothetical protein [Tateyamaria sp. SN6-1]|uniref:hypothetical protein n=1 Tax=Tateyamaria sp. SN6-1 TaxID=3092148 RepID=UPI0039F4D070